jgi:DNA repair protein RadC
VVHLLGDKLRDLQVEEFHLLALDSQSQVFRPAIAEAAAGIIVVHNHPSGDPTPSGEDRAATKQLVAAGQLLDLPVYDHVIIAGDRFVSFAAAGLL